MFEYKHNTEYFCMKYLYGGCADVYIYVFLTFVVNRSTSAFGDRSRSSWKRRLFPSVSIPDDEVSGYTNAETTDLPSGLFALIFRSGTDLLSLLSVLFFLLGTSSSKKA